MPTATGCRISVGEIKIREMAAGDIGFSPPPAPPCRPPLSSAPHMVFSPPTLERKRASVTCTTGRRNPQNGDAATGREPDQTMRGPSRDAKNPAPVRERNTPERAGARRKRGPAGFFAPAALRGSGRRRPAGPGASGGTAGGRGGDRGTARAESDRRHGGGRRGERPAARRRPRATGGTREERPAARPRAARGMLEGRPAATTPGAPRGRAARTPRPPPADRPIMDPLAHTLVGATLARTPLRRGTGAMALAAGVLAANASPTSTPSPCSSAATCRSASAGAGPHGVLAMVVLPAGADGGPAGARPAVGAVAAGARASRRGRGRCCG